MSGITNTTSIITANYQQQVLFGVNQDGHSTNPKIELKPATNNNFGRIFFGQEDNFPEGGINDQGLCYHLAKTPEAMLFYSSEKEYYEGNPFADLLARCSNVSQVIEIVEKHNIPGMENMQIMLADKSGESVVIGVGQENELVFTPSKDGFHVLSNFNLAYPETGNFPCSRYDIARDMLAESPSHGPIPYFRNILSATHSEGNIATIYSVIYELISGDIYIFYYHDYGNGVKFNINNALQKENEDHSYRLLNLFQQKISYYAEIQANKNNNAETAENENVYQAQDIRMIKLSNVAVIGEVYSKQLVSIGIENINDLLEKCSDPTGRDTISEISGINSKLLMEWVNHTNFYRIDGLQPDDIGLLENAGIDTVPELAQRNADDVFQIFYEHDEETGNEYGHHSLANISSWIEQAKTLPRLVRF